MTTMENFHDKRLSPAERRSAAGLPPSERQRLIKTLLVRYPRYKEMAKFIAKFHVPVDGGTPDYGNIGALLGATRSGKSWVLKDYGVSFPSVPGDGAIARPVVRVEIRNDMAAHDVVSLFFKELGYVSVPKIKTEAMIDMIIDALPHHSVELVVFDDVDNALRSNRSGYASKILGFIKGLLDAGCCNVLCAGRPALYETLAAAEQIKGRGGLQKKVLEPYRWHVDAERDQIRLLLDEIDDRLPFADKTGFAEPDLAAHFYAVSGGLIGQVMNYVRPAAYAAMNERAGRVERKHLVEAAKQLMPVDATFVPFQDDIDLDRLADDTAEKVERAREDEAIERSKNPFGKSRRKRTG
jgi:Bacterial TniB protein